MEWSNRQKEGFWVNAKADEFLRARGYLLHAVEGVMGSLVDKLTIGEFPLNSSSLCTIDTPF